jgi:hypothetical protein
MRRCIEPPLPNEPDEPFAPRAVGLSLPDELQRVLRRLVDRCEFRPTAYVKPHEYVCRKWGEEHEALCQMMMRAIAVWGYDARFAHEGIQAKYTTRYLNFGSYKYWGWGPILNRELLPDQEPEPKGAIPWRKA